MKTLIKLLPIVALALVGTLSACASTRTQDSVGQNVDDATLTTRVKAALIGDPATEARNIDVESRRGAVQLNGFVVSERGRTQATAVAKAVPGVRSVKNNLELKGEARSAGVVIEDGMLTGKVKLALAESPVTKAHEIEVTTHDGRVQLGGWVDSDKARDEAGRIARAIDGVTAVDNNLEIRK